MTNWDPYEIIEKQPKKFSTVLWETLTPFERQRVINRIKKQKPNIFSKPKETQPKPKESSNKIAKIKPKLETINEAGPKSEESTVLPFERSVWDFKTMYQVAFADMIEQRTTMMKFLLENYGIEAVEEFFLKQNPEWAEKLKVGKVKKIFAKIIAKLAPHMIMNKVSDIVIENAQYLVPLNHVTINEASNDFKIIEITKCPVLKQFKKTIKSLKFNDLEERYICTFACIPVLGQMASVGNCNVTGEYFEKGCQIHVTIKAKEHELVSPTESPAVKNGPS